MPTSLTGNTISSTYEQLLHVDGGPIATEKTVYSGTGVATALKVGTVSVSVGNIQFDLNSIRTLNANGNLNLAPTGTGSVVIGKVAITGGTIAGITDLAIADGGTGASNVTDARNNLGLGSMALQSSGNVDITGGTISGVSFSSLTSVTSVTVTGSTTTNGGNLQLTGNTLSSTDTNGNINFTPNGTGQVLTTAPTGYGAGAGGTVVQATSRTTGVTLNKVCGQITLFGPTTIGGHGNQEFTLTNSFIGANDVVVVCIKSGITSAQYTVGVTSVSTGSCKIALQNVNNATTPSDTPVLQFAVIKGAIA